MSHRFHMLRCDTHRRQHARRIARVNAGLLDVFLNAGDYAGCCISQRVHIELRCLLQKFVNQDGPIVREINGGAHVLVQALFIVNDRHRAAAQHVTRPHQHRITEARANLTRSGNRSRRSIFRLRYSQLAQQRAKTLSILGKINGIRRRTDDRDAGSVQTHCEIQRSLSAKLHNHARRLFNIDDVHHVFKRERFEVETVGSVVVSRNRFRIAVDHDRFVTRLVQRERRMTAAVIEFDALADAIRS